MLISRSRPYTQFNFSVDIDDAGIVAGFQECSGIDGPIDLTDRRQGGGKGSKPPTGPQSRARTSVSLKRGVIGAALLYAWLSDIQNSARAAYRDVSVELQAEGNAAAGRKWKLVRARIVKHVSGPMNAKGTDVALEELTLDCERVEPA